MSNGPNHPFAWFASMRINWPLGLFINALIAGDCGAWRNFKVQLTNVTVNVDADWASVQSSIVLVNNETLLNVHYTGLKDVPMVWAHASLRVISPELNDEFELLNATVNLCKLLATKVRDPMMRHIYEDITRFGRTFEQCPIKAEHYFLHELRVDENLFPAYTPDIWFEVRVCLFRNREQPQNTTLLDAMVVGRIDKSIGDNNFRQFAFG